MQHNKSKLATELKKKMNKEFSQKDIAEDYEDP